MANVIALPGAAPEAVVQGRRGAGRYPRVVTTMNEGRYRRRCRATPEPVQQSSCDEFEGLQLSDRFAALDAALQTANAAMRALKRELANA